MKRLSTALLTAVLMKSAMSQCELIELPQPDGAPGDLFGTVVSIDGEWALAGAFRDDDLGTDSGSATLFRKQGASWVSWRKLTASDGAAADGFGTDVTISGSYAAVSAQFKPGPNGVTGAVYVFEFDGATWMEVAILNADAAFPGCFGFDVGLDGDRLIIGAPHAGLGSAYVFRRLQTGWALEAQLFPDAPLSGNGFGASVSISGDVALVGARNDPGDTFDVGAAYLFRATDDTWQQEARIEASDPEAGAWFAYSVAVSADVAICGAFADGLNDQGAAYLFERDGATWLEVAKLVPTDAAPNDHFGQDVAVHGNTVVVGAPDDNTGSAQSGSAYLFSRLESGWIERAKLISSDAQSGDEFGVSVSMSGSHILVGAFEADESGDESGTTYLFGDLVVPYGGACPGPNGVAPQIELTPCPLVPSVVSLKVGHAPGTTLAAVLFGLDPADDGCPIWIGSLLPAALFVPLSTSGSFETTASIPPDHVLGSFTMQAFVPASPAGGVAASHALMVTLVEPVTLQ